MFLKIKTLLPSVVAVVLMLSACSETPKYETCGGQPVCPPPSDDKASDNVKKLRQDLAGKWKFASLATRDTIHKTEQNYTNLRTAMCISYEGGIQFLRDYKELVCTYCYELNSNKDTLNIKVEASPASKFCQEQFQSGAIIVRNDSLILSRRDSFIVKEIIYKRTNDDGTFKAH